MAKTKSTKNHRGPTKFPGNMVVLQVTNKSNPKRKGSKSAAQWRWMANLLPASVAFIDPRFNKWAERTDFHSTLSAELTWDEQHELIACVRDGQQFPKVAFNGKGDPLEAGATINGTDIVFMPGEVYHAAKEPETEQSPASENKGDESAEPEQPVVI